MSDEAKGLDAHQLKTLAILQAMAKEPELARPAENGGVMIHRLPRPHGDHFHLKAGQVYCHDATGLREEAVWNALAARDLARSDWPRSITLTECGIKFETGVERDVFSFGLD